MNKGKKVAAITGCNSGIGKQTAIELAKAGYQVAMLVRDSQKSRRAMDEIKKASGSDAVQVHYVDLASLDSIRTAVNGISEQYEVLDLLINNAGILKRKKELSPDGFELTIAVNYIALFELTNRLLPLLQKAGKARIVNLSSEMYKGGKVYLDNRFSAPQFDGIKAYSDSKLLVNYFTKTLAERLSQSEITVNALHPGVISTDVFREYPGWLQSLVSLFIASPQKGAAPSLYLATSDEVAGVSGKYFMKTTLKATTPVANDEELAQKIWNKTAELLT